MKSLKYIATFTAMALNSALAATTDPVGFVSVSVPANSDAILAVPLYRAAEFKGVINSISGNVITVAGSPGWTANQFVQSLPSQTKTYAIQIASGVHEGLIAKVTANSTSTLTVEIPVGEDLSGVVVGSSGDSIDVIPYWTPSTLIAAPTDGTELYYYLGSNNLPSAGTFKSPSKLFVFDTASGGWIDQQTETDVNATPLAFGTAFLVRNNSASSLPLSFVGSVPMSKHRTVLRTLGTGGEQDIRIGYTSPVPELLSDVGFPAAEGDQLFVFNNSAAGKFKAPSSILVHDGTQWLNSLTELPVPTFQLQPGNGYIFRKGATSGAQAVVWSDLQSYLAP